MKHWTYTQYDELFEQNPERLMLAFFQIREYRYQTVITQQTSMDTHLGRVAQIMHAKDRRLNRYGLHVFLYRNNKLIQRGGHRRREHTIQSELQESTTQPQKLILTTKGTGTLRYTLSWRGEEQVAESKGIWVSRHITNKKELQIVSTDRKELRLDI